MSATKKGKKTRKPLIISRPAAPAAMFIRRALADELLRRGYRVELITDSRGKDNYKGRLGEIPIMRFWPALWSANPACSKSKA